MQNRYIFTKLIVTLIALVLVFAVIGCPGPQNTGDEQTGDTVANGDQEAGQEAPATEEEEEAPPVNEEEERQFTELIGNREELTQEQVEGLTGFGVIMFPGSQLDTATSMHQSLVDGTELYRLAFGAETDVAVVADWYRANLETGFVESNIGMSTDAKTIGFMVTAPDNSWTKSISVQGIEGDGKSQISASLTMRGTPVETPEEPATGTAG